MYKNFLVIFLAFCFSVSADFSIIEHASSLKFVKVTAYLIHDDIYNDYACYIVDCSHIPKPRGAYEIVSCHIPQKLLIAQKIFPLHNLTKHNYVSPNMCL